MRPDVNAYHQARDDFEWRIPEFFNIGVDVCDRWATTDPERPAIIHEWDEVRTETLSFGQLRDRSNQAANALATSGVQRGDRVAVLLAQSCQTAVSHVAIYKAGAIAVPLFTLFGPEALEFRLKDSGARLLVTDAEGAAKVATIRSRLPELRRVLITGPVDVMSEGMESFEAALAVESIRFATAGTRADDPALIIYTSGTTGKPKGALHAHRVLLGHLPGVEMSHGGRIEAGDIFWTPADWAWIGGLLDVLLPALYHGVPVVARRFAKFDAASAFSLMSRHRVTCVFLPPTALKMLRAEPSPAERWPMQVRSIASGGESLGAEMLEWGRDALGVRINEFYGQTECNMVVSSCAPWFDAQPGSIGKAVPGHDVFVVTDAGLPLAAGEIGQIAVRAPDPVMFLGYWKNPQATADKFAGGCLLTGDQGLIDEHGFIRFVGRDDDVITSAGYRIGPGPIEDCLLGHAAVRTVAVVGVPDAQRTEAVKAFVVLADGFEPGDELTRQLQDHVRHRLAAHEYPRLIAYVDALPMTATGKVIRRQLREA